MTLYRSHTPSSAQAASTDLCATLEALARLMARHCARADVAGAHSQSLDGGPAHEQFKTLPPAHDQ